MLFVDWAPDGSGWLSHDEAGTELRLPSFLDTGADGHTLQAFTLAVWDADPDTVVHISRPVGTFPREPLEA